MQTQRTDSIWVDGSGRAVAIGAADRPGTTEDRMHAMDRLGWVQVREAVDGIEFWVNPLSAQQPTLRMAMDVTASLQDADRRRPVIIKVHDRGSRGSLVAETIDQMPSLLQESVELTSRPGFPLMQDRLTGCLPTEIKDDHVQDMWKFLVSTQFRPSEELRERVESSDRRAKIVTACSKRGAVQYLAHDRQTAPFWKQSTDFTGRYLDDLPLPLPLKRSLRSDLMTMLLERQIIVSFVRGLRRITSDAAPLDSFFRISIPLRWFGDAEVRPALVLLAPYG
ncbi:hypothetical protein BAL199_05204 [alpha proteobacterium BAL199]|jgi:hypothetical protein|nr:hypothetical protein BAL199_05204 [alpha proteobacterium BAL199]